MTPLRPVSLACLAACALLPAACAQYLDRKDTVDLSAGNAVHTNLATHVIDPWPRHAANTRLAADGERMQSAIGRYRRNGVYYHPSRTDIWGPRTQEGAAGAGLATGGTARENGDRAQ